jgi:hypothetical protein
VLSLPHRLCFSICFPPHRQIFRQSPPSPRAGAQNSNRLLAVLTRHWGEDNSLIVITTKEKVEEPNIVRSTMRVFQLTTCALILAKSAFGFSFAQDASRGKSRRAFLVGTVATLSSASLVAPSFAAIPMVTTEEFETIVRDSQRSIKIVEFTGPKSETVTVRLVDGTAFGIKDVIESSTDPRSPLKISAVCRQNVVPTSYPDLERILAAAPSKKKMYTNERVQKAAALEQEKKERMEKDEEDRLAALAKYIK